MVKLSGLLYTALLFSAIVCSFNTAEAGEIRVTEMAVTTKIVKGNPIDSVRRISSASVKALYCFTRFNSDVKQNTVVKHVWYRDNQVAAEYELPVKGKRWRAYSRKPISKGANGDWRVDVVDDEGKLLKSLPFRVN